MATAVKTFRARPGSRLSDEDAELAGRFIDERFDGEPFEPADVVAAARPKRSVLHRYFDWDDAFASEQWRLEQARKLVGAIVYEVVVVDDGEEKKQPSRAYHHVVVTEEDDDGEQIRRPVYLQAEVVWSRPDLAKQVILKAQHELRSWGERYRQYSQLADVVEEIDRRVLPLLDELLEEDDD